MRILITGGAGYVGSVVTEQLIRDGHQTIVYDDLSHGHRQAVPPQAEFVQASLSDVRSLARVMRSGIDTVMHLAGLIEPSESMKSPEAFFRSNLVNTLSLLEAMVAHGVKIIVFSSTAAVYGNPIEVPVNEESLACPTTAYGESKLMAENVLRWFQRIHRLRYCVLRYFNAAGATIEHGEAHEPETHLIPLVLHVAMGKRDQVLLYGDDYPTEDRTCVRDYVHVSDVAAAHILALQALKNRDELIYNVGTGRGASVRQVIELAREITGHPIPTRMVGRRRGDPAILVAGSEKLRRELGWSPRYSDLRTILQSAWDWHRRHPERYESEQRHLAEALTSNR
jgi:UDP-glucose 4-epimerase